MRNMDVYEQIKKLNLKLPDKTQPGGIYSPVKEFGDGFLYVSGTGTQIDTMDALCGKLGLNYTVEQGQEASRRCVLNALANLHNYLGNLNRIKRFVKILAFVAGSDDFYEQPAVMNGGSQLLVDIFGEEAGKPARSAIGVNALPGNIPVEIELIVELQ